MTSRRLFLRTATGVAAAVAATAMMSPAQAYQGNMERALGALQDALVSLREATPNKGGHKEIAVQLIQQAMDQVREGIQFANQHGGG